MLNGQEVLDYVRQPIQGRKPVGYDRQLLETYHPNEFSYLAQDIRDHLHNIGRSPEGNTYTRLDTQNLIELAK